MPTTDPDPTDAPVVRASDAERDRARALLRDAAAAGRITADEADERIQALADTRFRHELTAFTADLPPETLHPQTAPRPLSVRQAGRSASAALLALLGAFVALANRHRLIAAALIIIVIVACASLIAFVGLGFGDGHRNPGRHPGAR
jgi:hypothetical protein